ncbi:MAG: hypothetical protein COA63_003470 [Methylophaga sp.]|nr:hypothetical protein [Methylophaga sp.]
MKTVKSYKAGRKKQHDSLFRTETYILGDNPTREECEELSEAIAHDPITPEEEIKALWQWINSVVNHKAHDLGMPDGTEINLKTDLGHSLLFKKAYDAQCSLHVVNSYYTEKKYESAFNALLCAIPEMLQLQILSYEDEILAGKSRTSLATDKRRAISLQKQQVAKPIYDKYVKKHSKKRASELTAQRLKDNHQINVSPETVRGWFKKSW